MAEIEIDVAATSVPNGSSGELSLYEDVDDTGSGPYTSPSGRPYDNVDTVSLRDAKTRYQLKGFAGGSGNAYWLRASLDNTDVTTTSVLTAPVSVETTASGAFVGFESDWRSLRDASGVTSDGLGDHPPADVVAQGYPLGSLTHGLVAYYPFDGDVTDYALDNDGTDNTSAGYVSGQVGSEAKDFDGVDDYIRLGEKEGLKLPKFTYTAWVKTSGTSDYTAIYAGSGTNNIYNRLALQDRDGDGDTEILSTVNDGSDNHNVVGTAKIDDGVWHFVVFSYDGTEGVVYVDGSQDASNSNPSGDAQYESGYAAQIGSYDGQSDPYLDGQIDDLRIYDRALSSAEIAALYNRTTTQVVTDYDRLTAGLVGHWPLNEDVAGTAYDLSGRGNDSTSTTGTTVATGVGGAQARSFDGTDDYIEVSDNSTLDLGSNGVITVSLWMKTTTSDKRGFWAKRDSNNVGYEFLTTDSGAGLKFNADDGSVHKRTTSDYGLNDGNWHFVSVSWDNSLSSDNLRFFIDGALKETQSLSTGDTSNPSTSTIACRNWGIDSGSKGRFFNGSIDEVRIYNRALSQSEIQELARLGGIDV